MTGTQEEREGGGHGTTVSDQIQTEDMVIITWYAPQRGEPPRRPTLFNLDVFTV